MQKGKIYKLLFVSVALLLVSQVCAQSEKGVTSSGKQVDAINIDPAKDKAVSENGKIVVRPRLTRYGKIIRYNVNPCSVNLDCINCTDTVTCTSITMVAPILSGEVSSATLQIFADANYHTKLGDDIEAVVSGGNITASATNLSCNTQYYLRLTVNGDNQCVFTWNETTRDMTLEQKTFCTVASVRAQGTGTDQSHEHSPSRGSIDTVFDYEGNAYSVVQIGNQCWMKQNLRCKTRPSNGDTILEITAFGNSYSNPRAYYYGDDVADYDKYGCLYNFPAAMDIDDQRASFSYPHRGICPEGWHVPTDGEWWQLEKNTLDGLVAADSSKVVVFRGTGAGKLVGGCNWSANGSGNSSCPGNYSYADRNTTGFSAFPAGFYSGSINGIGLYAHLWSATPNGDGQAYYRDLDYRYDGVYRVSPERSDCFSVRCVRDYEYVLDEIQIDTAECTSVSVYAKMFGGLAVTVEAAAFTDETYTTPVGLAKATANAAKDTVFATFSQLDGNTSYYVRVIASDNENTDTSYATITTRCLCGVTRLLAQEDNVNYTNYEWGHEENGILYVDSVSDHEGNRYGVVQVGPQCWLRENMRATTSPSTGEDICAQTSTNTYVNNSSHSSRYPQARWMTWITDSATRVQAGLLYNWAAQVDYGVTSGNPNVPEWYGNRRGICPQGWHIIAKDEMDKISIPNLGGNSEVVVRSCSGKIASGSVTNDPFWTRQTNNGYPGSVNDSRRNSSGLSFLPAGHWEINGNYNYKGSFHLLTANQSSETMFYFYHFKPDNTALGNGTDSKDHSHSARCIRNGAITFSELVIDELTCSSAKFHAKFFNNGLDTVVLSSVKAGASTSTEFIQNNKAATVRISNDTVYAEMSNLDCDKTYTFYIKVYDKEYESYAAVKDTIERDATLSVSRPCTVTDVHSNEWSSAANQIDSVSDHEGNVYEVVQIGNQCWLRENMRCQSSPRPDVIKNFTKGTSGQSSVSIPYYYISTNANSETVNYDKFGCLYNWAAAMDTTVGNKLLGLTGIRRGICPEGWHIPADAEWYELEKQVANKALTNEADRTDYSASFDAGRLAAGCDWGTAGTSILRPQCYNLVNRNSTLFSALPAGVRNSEGFQYVNVEADFWSSTEAAAETAYRRLLHKDNNGISRAARSKTTYGFSVRCVRDVETTVADIQISKVTCSSVNVATKMLTGNVTNTVKVLVSTQSNFSDTVDVKTLTIPADSLLSTDFYDLKTNATYYVRIADKSTNFITELCACEALRAPADNEHVTDGKVYEVKDYDGNWYGVVKIGNLCWLRENMRCTTSPKTGDRIVTNNYYSTISRSAKWYANDSTTYAKYGLLYNACAALDVTQNATVPAVAASNSTTGWAFSTDASVQGICPAGWHLPTDSEWTRMEKYIVTDGHYNLSMAPSPVFGEQNNGTFPSDNAREGTNTPVSPMLAYLDTWTASTTNMATASADTNRNKVQFEAKAAGYFLNENTARGINAYAAFWTATPTGNNMFIRQMHNSAAGVSRLNVAKYVDISVRCVRDEDCKLGELKLDTAECTLVSLKAKMDLGWAETVTAGAFTDATYATSAGVAVATTNATKDSVFVTLSNLEGNTSYYIRVIASNNVVYDTSYIVVATHCMCKVYRPLVQEDPVNFTNYEWGHDVNGIVYVDSVADHEGNRYNVCEVGPQCWLRENIRVVTSPSTGKYIIVNKTGTTNSERQPQGRWYALDSAKYSYMGPLYNWCAQVDYGVESGDPDVPEWYSNRRGLCPKGWHLQVLNEFDLILTPNLGGVNELVIRLCGGPVGSEYYAWPPKTENGYPGSINDPRRNSSSLTFLSSGEWNANDLSRQLHTYHFSSADQTSGSQFKYYVIHSDAKTIETGNDPKHHSHSMRCIRDGAITLSELVIDELTCSSAKFHAKFFNNGLDTVVLSSVKAGASTSTEFIQNNKAATVRISNDTVYAEMSNLDCDKTYTFYIKVYDKEYESYAAVKDTIERDATLSVSRPCTVTDVHSNEWSSAANQIDSVSDHEGNVYEVVQIGNQCWLRENMRCQSSPRPDVIKNFTKGTGGQSSVSIPYYYISTNANSADVNYEKFGCLYNWAAAMDTTVGNKLLGLTGIRRGICPEGWHIPADVEWYELEKQVANKTLTSEAGRSGYSNSFDAGRLAAGCDWGTAGTSILRPQCYNLVNRNSTLFSALPAGVRNSGGFAYVKVEADFWSSTEAEATKVYRRLLHKDNDGVSRAAEPKDVYGFSVRCVRDVETTVADIQISKVTCSSVNVATKMLTGIVTDTVKVLVSTHSNFSDTVDVRTLTIPTDSLLSTDFYDLKTNTTYYVRIADKSANFTTKLCACDVLQVRSDNEHAVEDKVYEVADADGNWYGVVQIGNQCWLRENMRCTTSPKTGDRIVTNDYYSTISRSAKWYDNDSTTYAKYGLLYNACAALDVTQNATVPAVAASNSTTGWAFTTDTLVQGICPTGWHLPADSEWTRMENYIVTDGHYNLSLTPSPAFASKNYAAFPNDGYNEGTNTPVSPMLAYLDTWTASNTIRATASADTNRNKVQFEAKAAGYFLNNNTEAGIGNYAAFWTATPTGNNMFIRQMRNSTAGIGRLNAPKSYDISVRCVRDALYPEFTICTDTVNGTISLSTAKYTYKVEVINSNSAVVRTKYYAKPHSEFSKLPTGTYVVKATSKSGHVIMDTVDVVYTPTSCIVDSLKKNEFGLENRLDSVADHQGNKYVVVQVGNQCWMRENMRATTLPSGRTLGVCTENGHAELNAATVGPYCFLNLTSNGHPDFYEKYGCMYNWIAVMDTTNNANNTQITVDFPHRGICPDGWHVPEASEFVALFNYVVKDNHYGLDITASPAFDDASKVNNYVGTNTPISAMLAGGCDWTPTTNGNMAGSDAPYKNITRFSLTPGRSWTKGNFDAVYDYGASWTSTQSSATNILYYHIAATAGTGVFRYNGLKKYELAQSVRCVRNN